MRKKRNTSANILLNIFLEVSDNAIRQENKLNEKYG